MAVEDRQQLQVFVGELRAFLEVAVHGGGVVSGEAADQMMAAFTETVDAGVFRRVEEHLGSDALDEPADAEDPSGPDRLQAVGLGGANLALKTSGWRRAREAMGGVFAPRAARRMFRWANTILGSLAVVVPPAEALKELKEATENTYEDVLDVAGG